VCDFCPSNIHRVRERCFEEAGHLRGMLHSLEKYHEFNFFECNFKENRVSGDYEYDSSEVREAIDAEVAEKVLNKV
jgi:hypothetical protein